MVIYHCFDLGVSMTLMGVVKNYSGLLATRFFLGVGEVSTFGDVDRRKVTIANNIGILLFLGWVFPGASFLLTSWYCRHEMQTRLAIFFCAASLAGAFSGFLAFALMKMDGIGGLEGWRW